MENKINNNKQITAISACSVREVINIAVQENIQKEDIVSIFPDKGQIIIIYYK